MDGTCQPGLGDRLDFFLRNGIAYGVCSETEIRLQSTTASSVVEVDDAEIHVLVLVQKV